LTLSLFGIQAGIKMIQINSSSTIAKRASDLMNFPKEISKMARFRILLIYDDPELRREIASALNTKGYYVATATNGAEGYDMAIKRENDANISSISLSHTDGMTVLREWRQREMYAPVLMLTIIRILIAWANPASRAIS
jgi:response regulator RpfG family c-di-GMP phosphodiesterase